MQAFILSQWYREADYEPWFYRVWRNALRKYAWGVPILIIHNGGPTNPPYDDVEVVPAVDMLPHGRGTQAHYINCWRSMALGFELLGDRGVENVIFVGQNLIVGTEFVGGCVDSLRDADILYNLGCMVPNLAFTEYLAARPLACRELWQKRLAAGVQLEGAVPHWCRALGLQVKPFPKLWKLRDTPIAPTDTFCFHSTEEEVRRFAQERDLL